MGRRAGTARQLALVVSAAAALAGPGCAPALVGTVPPPAAPSPAPPEVPVRELDLPKELRRVSLPPYVVEPPDVLRIDSLRLVPAAPYRVEPLDVLHLFAPGAIDREPVNGPYPVDPGGAINLGPTYGGFVRAAGLTVPEIEAAVSAKLKQATLRNPGVQVTVVESRGLQPVRGDHPIQADGTVGLGSYGSVYVAGMTVPQVKQAVEQHLAKFAAGPEVSVAVAASRSKFFYVITDFAGSGERVCRLPSTGNETVLDAIALVGGLSTASSRRIWIARPAAGGADQIIPVDWVAVTRRGDARTNYQLLPGDRVFILSQAAERTEPPIAPAAAPFPPEGITVYPGAVPTAR